jgi:glycosyltransferase involved in cell wall biosynthesis
VEKKGHRYLIEACHLLQRQGVDFTCEIIGSGPLRAELETLITSYHLTDRVRLVGGLPRDEIVAHLAEAHIFVLACVIAQNGDRDGMPVAIAEAMAMGLPVISSDLGGIGELVRPEAGRLVPPRDAAALAAAIAALWSAGPAVRAEMGKRGRAIVAESFELLAGTRRLADLFQRQAGITTARRGSAFVVWGPPSHGPRSRVLARELGIGSPHYLYSSTRRGALSAPFRYRYQAIATLRLLLRDRPPIVFVQSPPSLAVLFVYVYCRLAGARYVVDAHSAAFLNPIWTWPSWLHRVLARAAITTIVTNEHFQRRVQAWGGHAFILRDVPTNFETQGGYPLNGSFNVAVVNTFSDDEPLDEILEAARNVSDVRFYVTGKKKMAAADVLARAPTNIYFTDFLPDDLYYGLLNGAHAVMCLTTRDHTMQRGACEALSLGKPIITSDWPLLRSYFHKGTVHVSNTREGICRGVLKMKARHLQYQAEIEDLQAAQRREWLAKKQELIHLVQNALTSN